MNKVILVGRLGRDPEVRSTNSGQSVANFTLATDESYKDKQGKKVQQTEWHRIVVWGKLADVVQKYVKKGDLISLEGRLQTREYEDKRESTKKYVTEVVVSGLRMLGGNNGGNSRDSGSRGDSRPSQDSRGSSSRSSDSGSNSGRSSNVREPGQDTVITDEDIPF